MRLLVITDLFPPVALGGYERTCATLVDGLRRDHDVVVLTSDLRSGEVGDETGVRRELAYLGPERREALRVPAAAARAASTTRRLLDEFRPDLVYVSNCLGVAQSAPFVALQEGVPTLHRLSELWFASSLYRSDRFVGHLTPGRTGLHRPWSWVVRAANQHPSLRLDPAHKARTAVSWCSDDLRARVTLPRGLEVVAERTIYPGFGRRFARLRRRPSTRPMIAYVGRVTTAKGANLAVRALAQVRQRHGIEADLVLAGDCRPEMRELVVRLARELGVAAGVQIAGPLGTEEIGRLLERAHAVVVPTVAHEAFGRICIEAALARVPVVAARIGGIPEALRDGDHALLFEPGDARACADALAATLCNPPATRARTERAFARAGEFSVDRFVAAEEELIGEAVELMGVARWRACA
jgi:glycogen(starch) synthase